MLSVANCIINQHNLWLVLIAAVICTSGSWATVRLYRRGRSVAGPEAFGWQFLAATAAGSSIWSTHFVAILAFEPGTPVSFDPVLTIISLLIAMVGTFAGFVVASFIRNPWSPALGGAIVGAAIAVMHYSGMYAYVIVGAVEWDKRYIVASAVLSVGLSSLAMQCASKDWQIRSKLVAVGYLTLAIVSLHFTGMAAMKITPFAEYGNYTNPRTMQAMALAISLVGLIIIGSVLASYLIDDQTQKRSLRQLRHMALNDNLTGLANRAAFGDYLDEAIESSHKSGDKFLLAAIDLDRFKEINDLHGHLAGDETLQVLAGRMRSFGDGTLFAARLGGDEFAVIMPFREKREAHAILSSLRDELIKPFRLGDAELAVGASIGACIYPTDTDEKTTLINHTDLALYRAKTDLSDKVCFFDSVMDEAIRHKRELAADLRQAIENHELEVYYQVQTHISDSTVTGYEALLRWHHPVRGTIPPSEFIPLAEESGLILPLGEWVLRTACTQCAPFEMRVAVNLSPVQFLHPNLAGLVTAILAETGMRASCLELELTESAIIHDKERTLVQLQQIRELGVTIALDDFGTGYSSLDTLRAFPFDKIKLDRSFIDELATSEQARSIIRAVLSLGKSLEIPVLAEGIETAAQLAILAEEGCDSAQGYLLGRPTPLVNIVQDLAQRSEDALLLHAMALTLAADGGEVVADGGKDKSAAA